MIDYCELLVGNKLTSSDDKEKAYQVLYNKIRETENFSMNRYNPLTKTYVLVKENSKLWKKGLEYARYMYNSRKAESERLNKFLSGKKTRV